MRRLSLLSPLYVFIPVCYGIIITNCVCSYYHDLVVVVTIVPIYIYIYVLSSGLIVCVASSSKTNHGEIGDGLKVQITNTPTVPRNHFLFRFIIQCSLLLSILWTCASITKRKTELIYTGRREHHSLTYICMHNVCCKALCLTCTKIKRKSCAWDFNGSTMLCSTSTSFMDHYE